MTCPIAGDPLAPPFRQRLRKMVDYLAAVQRPDGLMPQIGDADDGRLHILSGYGTWRPQDARHIFGPAACTFVNGEWTALAGACGPWEALWWGFDPCDLPAATPPPASAFHHFPNAGLTIAREPGCYLVVTNGIVGTGGFGNHKHNDLLGFEFHVAGAPVFVDPGSYVYTPDPEARNFFRGTGCHNTLIVDGEEQNELRPDWLFRMFEKAHPTHLAVAERPTLVEYRGRHEGYMRLAEPLAHERTYTLGRGDGALTIVDLLESHGRHRLHWHFHFAPGVHVSIAESDRVEIRTGALTLDMRLPRGLRSAVSESWYSPSYGVRVRCACVDLDHEEHIDGRREYVFRVAASSS